MGMKEMVHLASPTAKYNVTWQEAKTLVAYLAKLNIQVKNLHAVSTQGVDYDEKWIMENGWTPADPMNLLCDTYCSYNQTDVLNQTVAEMIFKFAAGEKWAFERLLESHGVSGKDLAQFYMGFESVQKAVAGLF